MRNRHQDVAVVVASRITNLLLLYCHLLVMTVGGGLTAQGAATNVDVANDFNNITDDEGANYNGAAAADQNLLAKDQDQYSSQFLTSVDQVLQDLG